MMMTKHHIPANLLHRYATGSLPHPFSVVVATHLSLCDDCRAEVAAHDLLGGVLLETAGRAEISKAGRARVLELLDAADPIPDPPEAEGIYPAPLVQALGGRPPRWRSLGGGIKQQILSAGAEGSLRLLFIPPGRAVPEHGHRGLEMTLVLQGAYAAAGERFARGDVECAHDEVDHQPTAAPGEACICLAATDAPLRFHAMLPRLLQPFFRI